MPTETERLPGESLGTFLMRKSQTDSGIVAAPPEPKTVVTPPVETKTATPPPDAKKQEGGNLPDFASPSTTPTVTEPEPADEPETSPRSKDWKAIKAAKRKAEDEIKVRDAKIAELEKRQVANPNLDNSELIKRLQTENEEMSNRFKQIAVEKHPQFEAHFNGRRNSVIEGIKTSVSDGARVAEILEMPNSQSRNALLDELIPQLTPSQQLKVGIAVDKLDDISRERNAEIARSSENFKMLQQQNQNQSQAQQKAMQDAVESQLSRAGSLAVFQKRDGDNDWNSAVEQRLATARHIALKETNPENIAKNAVWATAAPVLLSEINRMTKTHSEEVAGYQARIKALEGGSPDPTTAGGKTQAASDKEKKPGESYGQWITRIANAGV